MNVEARPRRQQDRRGDEPWSGRVELTAPPSLRATARPDPLPFNPVADLILSACVQDQISG